MAREAVLVRHARLGRPGEAVMARKDGSEGRQGADGQSRQVLARKAGHGWQSSRGGSWWGKDGSRVRAVRARTAPLERPGRAWKAVWA